MKKYPSANIPTIHLDDALSIPQVGLGLWHNNHSEAEFDASFEAAVTAGYRHFDSAQAYTNESLLGRAIEKSTIPRDEYFITTKIRVENMAVGRTHASFSESLKKLRTDYVDLLLLHFPVSVVRKKAWLELEKIHASGAAKSIGVSNYTINHLEQMKSYARIMPAVNQVELHVFLQQPELVAYCHKNNIVIEAYSPLAHARDMDDIAILSIAKKHGRSYAQIMLRWCIQRGLVVLPKSVSPERIAENINIFDFSLDDIDMKHIEQCNRQLRTCWDPTHIP